MIQWRLEKEWLAVEVGAMPVTQVSAEVSEFWAMPAEATHMSAILMPAED